MKNRVFIKDILIHCYQRTVDGGVLFYSFGDHLAFFTHYCILARKYGIHVIALCQMPDHIHDLVMATHKTDLESFKRDLNSRFAHNWNLQANLKGPVFESPYGSAPKIGDKKARTSIIYVGNNPVERRLVKKAEDYRWNYLAYVKTDHPFSKKLVIRRASHSLRKAIKEINFYHKVLKPLNQAQLKRLFKPLGHEERLQLVDYIINTYNIIDYKYASRFFGDYKDMVASMHVNTGSEYDINEVFVGKTDVCYQKMTCLLKSEYQLEDIHEILSLPLREKNVISQYLLHRTGFPSVQISKFMHLPRQRP